VAIVAFWLGATGWLAWRDLWPRWRPGGPPPYHIDLVEEVQRRDPDRDTPLNTRLWTVLQDGNETMQARSWVEHRPADDTFALHLKFNPRLSFQSSDAGRKLLVPDMRFVSSLLRVTREGGLRELEVQVAVKGSLGPLRVPDNSMLLLAGEVRGDHFFPRYRVAQADVTLWEGHLSAVEVSYHGSVLVPQHPVNRIRGLRPGQSWRMPVVDPFAATFGLADAVRHVNARVLPEPQTLQWKQNPPKTCLVIEYEGEDEKAATWVEVGSGLVQRQEAAFGGHRLVLQRDD
jgi:hypothetical protein